ncbi:vacuolar fusion protein MON1 [Chloropicon primus]|uniref:Vacuolar fusion protein MON1 homolog n=1 Tax=Chloropicon primus TaxID=1764295 RepID=A0A5B8MMU0_9CHLO|nr:vacuolar fusion protein MON1 [Chloropicon primus]UPR00579.1 vacuolar fusion protein MON1 [Chloropicon primus]|eukprot:QDZ21364.1 vacuolar fusion protein MON1 [Chloropicon primus]
MIMMDEEEEEEVVREEEGVEEEEEDVIEAEMADTGTPRLTVEEVEEGMARMEQQGGREREATSSSYQNRFVNKAPDEDSTMASWKRRKKHMFVFSNAGKPIFSRYGDEHLMSTFFAAAQAIISFVGDKWSDRLVSIQGRVHKRDRGRWEGRGAQKGKVVSFGGGLRAIFLEKGPLTFVAVSRTNEPTEVIKSQLNLLHSQFISILTLGIERAFSRSANFDMRKLLNGTGPLLRSVIHSGSWALPVMFGGVAPLPLDLDLRKSIAQCLQGCFVPDLMCSMLFTEDRVICISKRKRFKLDHKDLFLFMNFVRLNDSFKQSESFTPFCFPSFNASAFLYVYVSYVTENVCLALISGRADSFHELAEAKLFVQGFLAQEKVKRGLDVAIREPELQIAELPMSAGGGFMGETPLWHYVYYHKGLRQLLSPRLGTPPLVNRKSQKKVMRAYQEMGSASYDGMTVRWRKNGSFAMIACISLDFDLYATFDGLVDAGGAVRICNQLAEYIHSKEANLLMPVFQLKSNTRITASARQAASAPRH